MSSAPIGTFSRSPNSDIPPLTIPTFLDIKKRDKNINTITLDKQLGKGAFGTVYLCKDENGEELAVKCIKTKDFGIPSLIEAGIMSVIQHPNISKALKIHSTPDKLYIVQELGVSDLRVYRLNNSVSEKTLIKWTHSIAQAISCLHKYDIIHGDIKASNILVFPDQKIKVTDFTLSTHIKWKNNYRPCTSTHRPLEVWLNNKWNKSVDIWAFGCTLYEMIYGKSLFINQDKDASINALIDWYNYLPNTYKKRDINLKHRDTFHYTFVLADNFNQTSQLNKILISMLTIFDRPSIQDVLNNEMFEKYHVSPSMLINTPVTVLSLKSEIKIKKNLSGLLNDPDTIELAYNLYSRLGGMLNSNDRIKMATCAWIAHKMVFRENMPINVFPCELYEILQMERNICNYLSYRLIIINNSTHVVINK